VTARTGAARRYAEAAFAVAREDNALDRWASDLRAAAAVAGHEDLARVLVNPGLPYERRRAAFDSALGEIDPKVRNLVLLLLQRGRIEQIIRVSEHFQTLVDRHNGVLAGRATSAAPLSTEEAEALRRRMEDLTGARVELIYDVDPSLLGGVVIRIGSRLYDGSVRGRLERLRNSLSAQTV
jgi:F-type H+-transporting ATPase subunit delta